MWIEVNPTTPKQGLKRPKSLEIRPTSPKGPKRIIPQITLLSLYKERYSQRRPKDNFHPYLLWYHMSINFDDMEGNSMRKEKENVSSIETASMRKMRLPLLCCRSRVAASRGLVHEGVKKTEAI
jgi:hypothetical protein